MKPISLSLLSALSLIAIHARAEEAAGSSSSDTGVIVKVEEAVERGVRAAAIGVEHGVKAVERGAKAAAKGVERGVKAAAGGVQVGANATAEAANTVAEKIVGSSASEPEPIR